MKIINKIKNINKKAIGTGFLLSVYASSAMASTDTADNSIMKTLIVLKTFFTGPVPTTLGMIIIAVGGIWIAVSGDIQGGGKKIAVTALGIGIALTAVNIFGWLGMSGAIV